MIIPRFTKFDTNKIHVFLVGCILLFNACTGQKTKVDEQVSLRQRMTGMLQAMETMNIDSIQSYAYPKLFDFLSREESKKSMMRSFDFVRGKASMDSLNIDSLYPIFSAEKGKYARVDYSMVIVMPADSIEPKPIAKVGQDTGINHTIGNAYPAPQSTLLATLARNSNLNILYYEEKDGKKLMKVGFVAIAAKDESAKDWCFYTVRGNDETLSKLFPKKVFEKLSSKE